MLSICSTGTSASYRDEDDPTYDPEADHESDMAEEEKEEDIDEGMKLLEMGKVDGDMMVRGKTSLKAGDVTYLTSLFRPSWWRT